MTLELHTARFSHSFGDVVATVDDTGRVHALRFAADELEGLEDGTADYFHAVADALERYDAGEQDAFGGLELHVEGTDFQRSVWEQLCQIPWGETRTYGEIAEAVGHPKAARAVGMANNANPHAIAVPCHRVVGSGGRLVGYASGLDHKRALLAHESPETLLF